LTGETTLRAYARRIVEAFREPMSIRGARFDLTVCVGAYSAQEASIGYETVIRNAELALRKAQSHGSGSAHVFGPRDDAAEMERKALQTDLRFALERRELSLAYQPMLCLRTGKINGFEALLRWKHPTRGEISPAVFIPLAEETGAIEAIGAFVIRQACAAAARWPETIRVCLNVSAHQLRSRALCDLVEAALRDAEIPSSRLEIEITESVLIGDDRLAHGILTDLRKSGVRLALDDFGTGYSSLSYLRRLPFDRIKIDRSFVVGIVEDAGSAAIVKSIIGLADDLGMEIIAEGIETREQLDALRKLGCPEVQGYLIGKPMPGENVRGFLEASARRHAA
jgi:EAL domain-containing protein (putative c-di-GMP-specific phosphodiesterase class I)